MSRPPRYTPETAQAYVASIRARVGNRDPVALLTAAPASLATAIEGLGDAEAWRQPAPGAWSVAQILRHLSDCERVYGVRMRWIVAEDRPSILGFDQEAWAARLDPGSPADALAEFSAQRAMTLRWLATLSETDLDRVGLHAERGEERVRQIVMLLAGHDLAHIAQIERTRAAIGA